MCLPTEKLSEDQAYHLLNLLLGTATCKHQKTQKCLFTNGRWHELCVACGKYWDTDGNVSRISDSYLTGS